MQQSIILLLLGVLCANAYVGGFAPASKVLPHAGNRRLRGSITPLLNSRTSSKDRSIVLSRSSLRAESTDSKQHGVKGVLVPIPQACMKLGTQILGCCVALSILLSGSVLPTEQAVAASGSVTKVATPTEVCLASCICNVTFLSVSCASILWKEIFAWIASLQCKTLTHLACTFSAATNCDPRPRRPGQSPAMIKESTACCSTHLRKCFCVSCGKILCNSRTVSLYLPASRIPLGIFF